MTQVIEKIGAGEGNRTLVISLEGCCSTIELHPRRAVTIQKPARLRCCAALARQSSPASLGEALLACRAVAREAGEGWWER
jgi:hypothetical protein